MRRRALADGVALVPFSTPSGESHLLGVVREHPATAQDAIDFVADQQDQLEKEFLASKPMKGATKATYEEILLRQYQREQIDLDEALRWLLSPNALGQDLVYPSAVKS